jgi:hypothetical protein
MTQASCYLYVCVCVCVCIICIDILVNVVSRSPAAIHAVRVSRVSLVFEYVHFSILTLLNHTGETSFKDTSSDTCCSGQFGTPSFVSPREGMSPHILTSPRD